MIWGTCARDLMNRGKIFYVGILSDVDLVV